MNHQVAVIMSLYKSDVIGYVKLAMESILNQSYTDGPGVGGEGPIDDEEAG